MHSSVESLFLWRLHERLQEKSSLQMQLQKIMQNDNGPATRSTQAETSSALGGATGSITGVDTFVLDYKVSTSCTEINSEYFLGSM